MNREEQLLTPRKTVLPPLSIRTLHHPSFLPLYTAAGLPHHGQGDSETVHPITPAEFFYTDPTMVRGRRIPNKLRRSKVFDGFQLNTPLPIMSACLAPPNCPDPFRSGPHPTRNLGSQTWRLHTMNPQVQPRQVILQLTQEEEQAITNLLKLHHQIDSPSVADSNPSPFLSHPSSKGDEDAHADVQYLREAGVGNKGRGWSDTELEAADTLSSCFKLKEVDLTAKTHPSPLLCQSTQTHQESDSLVTPDQNCIDLSCTRENGNIWSPEDRSAVLEDDLLLKPPASVIGGFSEVKERVLSDLEEDAVHALLNLRDAVIVQ